MSFESMGRSVDQIWAKSSVAQRIGLFVGVVVVLVIWALSSGPNTKTMQAGTPSPNAQAAPEDVVKKPQDATAKDASSDTPKTAAIAPEVAQKTVASASASSSAEAVAAATTPGQSKEDSPVAELEKEAVSNWDYNARVDPMSGQVIQVARVDADKSLSFRSPYDGPNKAVLVVRSHPKRGTDVMLRVEKGQFICGYDDCSVMVRFDEKPAVRFQASEPSDNSSTVLFLTPAKKLIANLRKSKVVRVQATFYQEGSRIMTFQSAGLVWD